MKTLTARIIYWLLITCLSVWSLGIVYYCIPGGGWLAFVYVALVIGLIIFRKKRYAHYVLWGLLLLLNLFYLLITPTNDRPWKPSWSRQPHGKIYGDSTYGNRLLLHNIRDFKYRAVDDFDVWYKSIAYDLDKLETLDLVVCHWDGMEAVSHTMLSFGFSDGQYLALSAETRLAEGDVQGTLPGLYKRFGFQIIFATEDDLFALRSNYRHEDLYLYRIAIDREHVRAILESFIERVNKLNEQPEFYNTLTHNCTTGLLPSLEKAVPIDRWNLTVILNGYLDKHMFRKNRLQHREGESFEELKKRSAIPYDFYKDQPELYSRKIREHVGITPASED